METRAKEVFRLWLVIFGLCGGLALACTVPVFRYALDHWSPDAYRLEVPVSWLSSDEGQRFRKFIQESGAQVELHPLEEGGALSRLLMPEDGAEVWRGTLDETASTLLVSPAREELLRRILAGESMVWVMVRSGNERADTILEERLRSRLEYLGSVAAIPEQDPTDPINKLGPGPALKVGFSCLVISRDDPAEQVFLRMLAGPRTELLEKEAPFGAVVFGRGRVLGAWPVADLEDEGIDEVSLFLLGACSCRVKFQNPGWDLALAVNWDEALQAAQMEADREGQDAPDREAKVTLKEDQEVAPAPEFVRIEADSASADNEGRSTSPASGKAGNVIAFLVAGLGVLVSFLVFTPLRKAKGS